MLTSLNKDDETIAKAEELLARAKSEAASEAESRVIIDMVTTIIWYRFENLERQEIEAMLNIATKETRLFKEGRKEGIQEGIQEGQTELVIEMLSERFENLSESTRNEVSSLPASLVKKLGLALFKFSSLADLQNWLDEESSNP